jgi:hypothetical protein
MKYKAISSFILLAVFMALMPLTASAASSSISAYTPYELTAKTMPVDGLHPSGSAELVFKINNLQSGTDDAPWAVEIQKKIGDQGDWTGVSFVRSTTYLSDYSIAKNTYRFEQLWNESTAWKTDILVSYRVRTALCDSTFSAVETTPWSNIASIGIKSSAWASPLIDKATKYGLIPASLMGVDYTQPITREQFAELSVKLYEIYTHSSAEPVSPNPFKDSSNPEILKSYKLGIVKGTAADKFEPKSLTNREQIAAMLYRAVKAMKPNTDFSTAGAPAFADANAISAWALDNVKFMSKQGFISGVGVNRFDPKGVATCEQAIAIAVRVYEKYAGIN